jgi:hypothetical protein
MKMKERKERNGKNGLGFYTVLPGETTSKNPSLLPFSQEIKRRHCLTMLYHPERTWQRIE